MTIQEKYRLHLKSLSDELLTLQKPIRILDAIKWPRHLQAEFLAKRSFSYGLWSPDRELQFWGGVYLYPSVLPEVEVELFFWKVADAPLTDAELETELRTWLGKAWRWSAPRLPGRDTPWSEWPGVTYPW